MWNGHLARLIGTPSARHPKLVLIDELVHVNILGWQYEKRYQDVEAMLAAGIDVFSTVNIQHLEQLRYQVSETSLIRIESLKSCLVKRIGHSGKYSSKAL